VKASISKQPTVPRAQFLAGDLALDFLNTRMGVGNQALDLLQTDEDVFAWLKEAGIMAPEFDPTADSQRLLRAARSLRENTRSLVEKRKAGRRGNPSLLNSFLSFSQSHPRLIWSKSQGPCIERIRHLDKPEAMLAPLAEAAAVLLATANFNFVKRCEGESCSRWFFDRSRSHHRRWCSTRDCGNRHKVAAYRERTRAQSSGRRT
jgi:predicted RNA-binding Zn ribbon-like protein